MQTRWLRHALGSVAVVVLVGAGAGAVGCLSRPVVAGEPITSTNFTTQVQAQAVDKIDLLFSIDNSASMGDKQAYLEEAIPDLLTALVTPNCVDASGKPTGQRASASGVCASGAPEFPPVHDMHIGIVSSSLGPRLGDQTGSNGGVCLTTGPTSTVTIGGAQYPAHNDDQAHLLTRSSTPNATSPATTPLPDAPNGFLDWFPGVSANSAKDAGVGAPPLTDPAVLGADFQDLVDGIQQYGCGIESQLESWYRFLIQPDPYATLALTTGSDGKQHASWVGVDTTILQQRKDFLRPDSLVAIIVLTDENDSEVDVRSYGGTSYYFMDEKWTPPRGTSACAANPNDPACESCSASNAPANDPSCADGGVYSSKYDWGFDINLRHVHTKAKYGIDPQFPIGRYVTGLTSSVVPDRDGEYPAGATSYVGTTDCQNPLFAAALPDVSALSGSIATDATISTADANTLCKLPPGTRSSNLVFYTIIGGVPHQLLQDGQGNTKAKLEPSDWVSILGNDPEHFDYTGIDPHMVESQTPRNGTAADPAGKLAAPSSPTGTDPINGREWITNQGAHADLNVDREYACTFKLKTPRDCTNKDNQLSCDCSTDAGVLTPEELSPVCDPDVVTTQDYAKAYPTIRELLLANKIGDQGIVASICPIDIEDNDAGDDPNYGYRPAVATIIARLQNALNNECLPQKLTPNAAGVVDCLILVSLPAGQTCDQPGLAPPDPAVLATFVQQQEQAYQQGNGAALGLPDPAKQTICAATQITGTTSCKQSPTPGWCYVEGAAAGGTCAQSILFTPSFPPAGAQINLQCIEDSNALTGDGG